MPWDQGFFSFYLKFPSLSRLLDGNSHSYGHTYHGVVACADQTHHLYVRRNRGGSCELCVGVHTA